MTKPTLKNTRVLAIVPVSRGIGFALKEGVTLVDWGIKSFSGQDRNAGSLRRVEQLLAQYRPGVLILPEKKAKRGTERIAALAEQIAALAGARDLPCLRYTDAAVHEHLLGKKNGTKHAVAQLLAERFPDELAFQLPPKRKAWMNQDYRMGIFDAVALALMPAKR